ncbi:S-layer homology domain-containing protein [Caldicellulosiruptoraceae bacterium PP1]
MKRLFLFIVLLAILFTNTVFAEEGYLGYEGGLSTYKDVDPKKTKIDYYEYSFVTGKPVLLTGTVDVKIKSTKTQDSLSYSYDLSDDTGKITIKRSVKLSGKTTTQPNGSLSKDYKVTGYTENLTVNGSVYKLNSWSFSKSSAVDLNVSVNFFQGEWNLEKKYDKGLIITSSGENYGYYGYWGNGEFQKIRTTIQTSTWEGYIDQNITLVQKILLEFKDNNTPSSINGTYTLKSKIEGSIDINYDLPLISTKTNTPTSLRVRDKITKKIDKSPIINMSVIPYLPKLKGYIYENAINTAFAFGGFDKPESFVPNEYITRGEFSKLLMQLLNTYSTYYNPKTTRKVAIFKDVPTNHPYYGYIYAVNKANLMQGKGSNTFKPDDYITNVEAAYVISKALGFNKKINTAANITPFIDDQKIPSWAKDSIYLLKQSDILLSNESNQFLPNDKLTKGQAAQLLLNLINYLRQGIADSYINLTIFHNE